ncbi:carbonic anhydrase-like [Planococcus citri]|uniref:carbonic anhydrase-like n=1 Tax=Planococcus citri TaxID=170843 RepID=UPI0031FA1E27
MRFNLLCFLGIFLTIGVFWGNVESRKLGTKKSFTGRKFNTLYKPVTINADPKNTEKCPGSSLLRLKTVSSARTILKNTGESVQTNDQRKNFATVTGGPLKGIYNYLSFTYYWASNTTTGVTGTTINKQGFPYGVRVFYINRKYKTFKKALLKEDGFADLVYLYNICSETNKAFGKVSQAFQKIPKAGMTTPVPLGVHAEAVNLVDSKIQYYTYTGNFENTRTGKKYPSSTVVLFKPDSKFCITQHQFNQTFSHLTDKKGRPLANILTHDSTEVKTAVCTGATSKIIG